MPVEEEEKLSYDPKVVGSIPASEDRCAAIHGTKAHIVTRPAYWWVNVCSFVFANV